MFREVKNGNLKIFSEPKEGAAYSIGCDVAEGLISGDYSTAFIIDRDLNHVASYCGHIAPDLFGEMLCRLGDKYNSGLLTVEINNHGILTLDRIKRRNYPNIYTRLVEETRGAELQRKIGWQTTEKTKAKMLDEFVAHYRDGKLIINDLDLLREMAGVVTEDNGKVILNGKDRVVSACLAIQGLEQVVIRGEFKAKRPGQDFDNKEDDIINMTIEDKLRYYKRKKKSPDSFG